jgi:hypothetical protein
VEVQQLLLPALTHSSSLPASLSAPTAAPSFDSFLYQIKAKLKKILAFRSRMYVLAKLIVKGTESQDDFLSLKN